MNDKEQKTPDVADNQKIPEVTDNPNSKKIIAFLIIFVSFIVILYANTASSKKKTNKTITAPEVAQTLSFNQNEDPVLGFDNSKNNSKQTHKTTRNIPAKYEASKDYSGDFKLSGGKADDNQISADKLIEFKKMMDSANERQMREIIKRRQSKTLIYKSDQGSTMVQNADSKHKSFADRASEPTAVVSAVRTTNLASSILEGTIIHATLETAINSDLPGSMRAVINQNVYSADGMNKLLSPGDRLVMKYTSKNTKGVTRVFAVGSRIIKSDGISINLGSNVASPLGVVGLGADSVDTHFFERFGEASLLAVLSAGAATVGVDSMEQFNSRSSYRGAIADNFSEAATASLQQNKNMPTTLYIGQGKEITIFVAKDISFESVYGDII